MIEVLAPYILHILVGFFFLFVAELIVLVVMYVRTSSQIRSLTYPLYENTVERAEHEADEVISKARAEAKKLMMDAEHASAAYVEKRKEEYNELEKEYKAALAGLTDDLSKRLTQDLETAKAQHGEAVAAFDARLDEERAKLETGLAGAVSRIDALAENLEKQARVAEERLAERIDAVDEKSKQTLQSIEEESRQRINEHLTKRFEQAEEGIAAYQRARMNLIDNRIVSLVEEATKIVLRKKLTVDDQADLVQRALEEAKAEGVI